MNNANPKPSQAKPSQAKPSQAKVSNNKRLASRSNILLGKLRSVLFWILPESSLLHKRLLYAYHTLKSSKRNGRKTRPSLTYMTNDVCNLNCKGCGTFSPIVTEPRFVDMAQVKRDMMRLRELFGPDGIEGLWFMGGESLLHANIAEIISVAGEMLPGANLDLLTNGVLLTKMPAEFWESCRKNRVHVQITPYPIKLDNERIADLAEEYGVNLTHYITMAWTRDRDVFRKFTFDKSGKCDIEKNFKRCSYSVCYTMWDNGRLYQCSQSCFSSNFNKYFGTNLEITEKDYVDIYKVKDKEEILDFLEKPVPFCRYCDMDNWKFGLPWETSKKDISEWM